MKLNIAIVALALSSTALTFAAPLPTPMPQGWGFLRKAVGKISGKSSSAAQELSIYADDYVPQYERYSDATHPYIPKEHSSQASPVHRSHGSGDSSRPAERDPRHGGDESDYLTSPEASPVHRSHGSGDSSRPAERDPRHGGDESGHYPQTQYTPHTLQHASYGQDPQPQYTPYTPRFTPSGHYPQLQYTPQHASYGHYPQPQYAPNFASNAPYGHDPQPQPSYVSHGHVWPEGPPGGFYSYYSSHDAHRFPVGGYLSAPPPNQDRVGWFF
ncbi:uncharacterized protein UHO2_06671 [Ustilago hordei]|uniref:uncharacterized protein n=1 Tax=Ustilago hordei TaxID=120017 RepID=UPI001A472E57|nr:uncharacterized protein UHO2_06671 [Ustilago hordei]SYW85019.1 uncharacterized protein UHO2_06671 [Ustilago hordei]